MRASTNFPQDLVQAADGLAIQAEIVRAATHEKNRKELPTRRKRDARFLIKEDGNWKLVDYFNYARKAQVSVRKNGET
jgi:hypothetical protein